MDNRLIIELREKTGAGMMDCKKALAESDGKLDQALTFLRKKGLADAAKKSARVTKEGAIAYAVAGTTGAIIELNCETDFVARGGDFRTLAATLAQKAAAGEIRQSDQAKALIQPIFERLGENMSLRRLERFELKGPGLIAGYIHSPDGSQKKGALIEISASAAKPAESAEFSTLARDILLQIVGYCPKYLDRADVPAADVEREREIHAELLRKEGKPEAAMAKILEGKLNKLFYQQYCLLDQISERHNKMTISAVLQQAGEKLGGKIAVTRFARYQLGE